jgi:hypothetical protein
MIGLKAEPVLRDLGMGSDIIKTMHRPFTERWSGSWYRQLRD